LIEDLEALLSQVEDKIAEHGVYQFEDAKVHLMRALNSLNQASNTVHLIQQKQQEIFERQRNLDRLRYLSSADELSAKRLELE
jgi:hypothetical protein